VDSPNSARESFETWKKDGKIRNKEIWLKRKDGSFLPALISANYLHDENGDLIGNNMTIRDISEIYRKKKNQKELESEFEQTKSLNLKLTNDLLKIFYELETQNDNLKVENENKAKEIIKNERLSAIGQLASRLAHDMRNPLSVIKSTIEIMKVRSSNIDEKTLEHYSKIQRAIARMNYQLEKVLDFVRIKPLKLENTSAYKILNPVIHILKIPKNIKINKSGEDIAICCDPKSIEIVLVNLITNAIQALDGKGEIKIRTTNGGEWALIEVEDNGPAIPDEILPKIFEPLFTTKQTGTGLGLSSCKSIIHQHGGTITVRNNPNTFTIRLPGKLLEPGYGR